jgi:hypothetical protein
VVEGPTTASIEEAVWKHIRTHNLLSSLEFEVHIDDDQGWLDGGRFGTFTVERIDKPITPAQLDPVRFLRDWATDLRSGLFPQGQHTLVAYDSNDPTIITGYCCLGVAGRRWNMLFTGDTWDADINSKPPERAGAWVSPIDTVLYTHVWRMITANIDPLDLQHAGCSQDSYAGRNDGDSLTGRHAWSFHEIANHIEAELLPRVVRAVEERAHSA